MRRLLAVLGFLAGCPQEEPEPDILNQLTALPGVTVTEWVPPEGFEPEAGYRYFDITFTQSVDHDLPGETFQQHGYLMHKDSSAPLVFYTSGYGASWRRYLSEPALILRANQLSIDYRFYGGSRPENPDWSKLTVQQNLDDEHAILSWLADVYHGNTIQTGGSKGGENALFHMWLRPEDLDAVVAYVAPVITDLPDARYATVLDDIGIDSCTNALRAVQRAMLMRRSALETRAAAEDAYAIAGVAHAVETAIVELEFSFWMTRGEPDCAMVPVPTATDAQLYQFLVDTGGPAAYGDEGLIDYGQQYIYQDHYELGYPVWQHAHMDSLMMFSYEDWSAYMPAPVPIYNASMARGLAEWLAAGPDHIIFIGGEWDPWGAGYPPIAQDENTLVYSVSHGTHWSSGLYSVEDLEYDIATDALYRWANASPAARVSSSASPGSPAAPHVTELRRSVRR